ncbi:MAG: TetR/AcrR family transcriptional regulator [Oscillospiraceae bacterium]
MNDLLKAPRTKKGVETLNNILSAAAQLIYEKGYYGANIAEITQLAGVATGTFYVYFDSKLSLYRYLLLQFSHKIRKELALKIKACSTRRDSERAGLKAWLEFVLANPYVYNIIWESLYVDRKLFMDYYETFCASYLRGLDAAKEKGEVRNIDSVVLAYTMMGISNFLGLKYGMFSEETVDLDYVTDEVMKLLDGGMFTKEQPILHAGEGEKKKDMNFRVEVDFEFLGSDDPSSTEE